VSAKTDVIFGEFLDGGGLSTLLKGLDEKPATPSWFSLLGLSSIPEPIKIPDRSPWISTGYKVPDQEELALGDGKRLDLAIMFLDICGFSSWDSETEEEQKQNLRALSLFFNTMVRIAEKMGGTVEKNTGDGLMVWFQDKWDRAPGNSSDRAVAAAIEMMVVNGASINSQLISWGIPAIQFKISIEYGSITIARFGAAQRFKSNVAVGTKANVANKILKFAQAGDIIIGHLAREHLSFQPQRDFFSLLTNESGWNYRINGAPYPIYRYRPI
jgi:adenylate cyclase